MVGAHEGGCIAGVGAAHPVATVPADVQERSDFAVSLAGDKNRVFTHVGGEEVAGVGYLGLMAEEEPAAGENLLLLLLIDIWVDEYAPIDQTSFGVDEGAAVQRHIENLPYVKVTLRQLNGIIQWDGSLGTGTPCNEATGAG